MKPIPHTSTLLLLLLPLLTTALPLPTLKTRQGMDYCWERNCTQNQDCDFNTNDGGHCGFCSNSGDCTDVNNAGYQNGVDGQQAAGQADGQVAGQGSGAGGSGAAHDYGVGGDGYTGGPGGLLGYCIFC